MLAGAVFTVGTLTDSLLHPQEYTPGATASSSTETTVANETISATPEIPVVAHISTPTSVRAVYMSSWVAATPSVREKLLTLIDETEINAVIIDIKDGTGKVSFPLTDPKLSKIGSSDNRIRDISDLIKTLHSKGVYVIGRIATFQDPYYASAHPEVAIRHSDGTLWADRKGELWVDPGAQSFWEYIADTAKASYAMGFDEINFDYIRYPSDGDMSDMILPVSGERYKPGVIASFWSYIGGVMKASGIPSSGDVFGMTTTTTTDLNIGQILEDALLNFDYVAPMVYPSHYPAGFLGFKNPAEHPYEVIKDTVGSGIERAKALGVSPSKIRPWLQDFDMGAEYGPDKVRAQIQALNDLGISSWMLWDPSNVYTKAALKPKGQE